MLKLTKDYIRRIAVGRFFKPYLSPLLVLLLIFLGWAICFAWMASKYFELNTLPYVLVTAIGVVPLFGLVIWLCILEIKENKFAEKFLEEHKDSISE